MFSVLLFVPVIYIIINFRSLPQDLSGWKKQFHSLLCFLGIILIAIFCFALLKHRPTSIARTFLMIDVGLMMAITFRWQEWGSKILVPAGAFSNILVVLLNGWKMPVDPGLAARVKITVLPTMPFHAPASAATKLPWLMDRFYFPGSDGIFSIGDVLLVAGLMVTAIQIYLRKRSLKKKAS